MNKADYIQNANTLRRELLNLIQDTTRSIDDECGYPLTISQGDYNVAWNRHGIASRVNNLMPEECWNVVPEIIEDETDNETAFEKEWKALEKEFHIFNYLSRLDILSGIGQYGALLIGVNDGKKLYEPVDGVNSVDLSSKKAERSGRKATRKLLYLKPFSEMMIQINTKDENPQSPRFGRPLLYSLRSENLNGELEGTEILVHWTRIIHVVDGKLSSETFGTPRMQQVYNYLLDIKKLLGGSAEMFWRGAYPGLAFEVNPERTAGLTSTEKKEIREEFDNYSNKLQRYMALVGVSAKSLAVQVASPKEHFDVLLKAIGITLGIPYRLLVGSEEAKLASSADTTTWNRRIKKRQENYCTVEIVHPFIDRLIAAGILSEPKEYTVAWPDLAELDPKDEATIMKDKTDAIAKYVASSGNTLIPPHQFLTTVMGYTDEEAEQFILEAEEFQDDTIDEDELNDSDEDNRPDPNSDDS